jgi:hypothetical protein
MNMTSQTQNDGVVIAVMAQGRRTRSPELVDPVMDAVSGLVAYDDIGFYGLEEFAELIVGIIYPKASPGRLRHSVRGSPVFRFWRRRILQS